MKPLSRLIVLVGLIRSGSLRLERFFPSTNGLLKTIASLGTAASCVLSCQPCLPAFASDVSPTSQLHSFEKRLAKQQYIDLAKGGDKAKLADLNRYVVDYAFGTITNMFFDQTGGEKFADGLAWRSKLRQIESAGESVFPSVRETDRVIQELISGLGDEYSYYKSPFVDNIDELGVADDRVRFPYLGFELSTTPTNSQFSYLYTLVSAEDTRPLITAAESASSSVESSSSRSEVMDDVSKWGAVVTKIYPQSPAERAGLRVGDILLECNGADLSSSAKDDEISEEEFRSASVRSVSFSDDFDTMMEEQNDISPLSIRRHKLKEILTGGEDFGVPVRLSVLRPPHLSSPSTSSVAFSSSADSSMGDVVPAAPPLSRLLYHLTLSPENILEYTAASKQDQSDHTVPGPSNAMMSNRPQVKAQRHRSSSFPAPFAFAPFQPSHDSNNNRRPSSAVSLQELHGGFWASSKLCGDAERDDGSSGYDAVKPKSCETNLISYVRLTAFTRSATTDLARTLKQQVDRGTSLIVLDLRNNYGGIIQDAMVDASMFLANHPDTVLCYTVGPRGYAVHDVAEWLWSGSLLDQVQRQAGWEPPNSPDSAPTASISIVPDSVPVAILVNEGTASAAEMFTAALQENGRATVLGTRTYGKSAIQHDFLLPNGGRMHLTVAEYLTPHQNHLTHDTAMASTQTHDATAATADATARPSLITEPSIGTDAGRGNVKSNTNVLPFGAAGVRMASFSSSGPSSVHTRHQGRVAVQQWVAASASPTGSGNAKMFSSLGDTFFATAPLASASVGSDLPHRTTRYANTDDGSSVVANGDGGGLVPDVVCNDAPVPDASKDFCTIEAISLTL